MKILRLTFLFRLGLILLLFLALLAAGGYWYINRPAFHAYAQERIKEELGIDVRWSSLQWSIYGWLKIVEPSVDYAQNNVGLNASADSLYLSNLFSGKPDVEWINARVRSATAIVASASRGSAYWNRDRAVPNIRLSLGGVFADPAQLMELQSAFGNSDSEGDTDLSILDSITASDIRLDAPYSELQYTADATARLDADNQSAQLHVVVSPNGGDNQERATVDAVIFPLSQKLQNAKLHAENFPVQLAHPIASASLVVNGTAEALPQLGGEITCLSNLAISNVDLKSASGEIAYVSGIALISQTVLDGSYAITNATVALGLSAASLVDSSNVSYRMPASELTVRYDPSNDENVLSVEGTSALVDRFALSVEDFPFTEQTFWKANVELNNRSISKLKEDIPIDMGDIAKGADGLIDLRGSLEGRGFEPGAYLVKTNLSKGSVSKGNARIEDASLSFKLYGAGTSGRMESMGSAVASYIESPTKSLTVEPVFQANGRFDLEKGTVALTIPQADAGLIHSVSGWYNKDKGWRLEGDIPIDEAIPQAKSFLPVWGRGLEGVGALRLDAWGDGASLHSRVTCPDLMLYSMDDDYTYGAQLRELILEGSAELGETIAYGLTVQASTPYVNYGASDIDFPSDVVRVQIQSEGAKKIRASLQPPGGGSVVAQGDPFGTLNVDANGVSLDKFLLPVLNRFVLKSDPDAPQPYQLSGTADANLQCNLSGDEITANGTSQIHLPIFYVPIASSFLVENVSIAIPIAFPINYESLNKRSLSVFAGKASWDGASYDDVQFSIPMGSKTIRLASDLMLPVLGGEARIDFFELNDWLGDDLQVGGAFRLSDIQLEKVRSILPIVPGVGTLSGNIDRVAYGNEGIELKGELVCDVFGGQIVVRDTFLRNAFGGSKVIGFSADIDRMDLQKMASYFQYGKITGIVSGEMRNTQLIVPPAGSHDWIMPDRLDIEVTSDNEKEGSVSQQTLMKIVELSGKSDIDIGKVKVSEFRYSKIGLRVLLDGVKLRLIGTLDDGLFLAPSKSLFANKIGIRLGSSDRTIDFLDFWNRLLDQVGAE